MGKEVNVHSWYAWFFNIEEKVSANEIHVEYKLYVMFIIILTHAQISSVNLY